MKISDFKNKKILTEFGRWQNKLYEDSELNGMLRGYKISQLDSDKRAQLEAILEPSLTDEETEFILKILNSLSRGNAIQKAFANIPTYTTLRLAIDKPDSEWCVDKLGFYCYSSNIYEVNYIGLLLKEIAKYVIDLASRNRKMLTNEVLYVFLTSHMVNNPHNNQEPLPDFILNADLVTIRKWLIAKVLIHEMAHALLDLPGKPHGSYLEESMANLVTISVAEFFGDSDFFKFVCWFIEKQSANYNFAINLYNAAKSKRISPQKMLCCVYDWAKLISNGSNIFQTFDVPEIIFDQQNSNRVSLADKIISQLIKMKNYSGNTTNYPDLKKIIWEIIVRICYSNHNLVLKDFDPSKYLSGKVTVYTQNMMNSRNIRLTNLIDNFIELLCLPINFDDWKNRYWNGYTSQIYRHLLEHKDELEGFMQQK